MAGIFSGAVGTLAIRQLLSYPPRGNKPESHGKLGVKLRGIF